MFKYEIFRQTVVGWFLIFSFLLMSFPYLKLQEYTLINWGILFIGSLLLSSVFGYFVNQLVQGFLTLFKIRPNDVMINIEEPYKRLSELASKLEKENSPLKALCKLSSRDLYRFIWVTYANKDLRDRNESYWERYYTNLNIIIVTIIGLFLAIIIVVPKQDILSCSNIVRYVLIFSIINVLWYNNLKYLSICTNIENTWINAFSEKLGVDQEYFVEKLFERDN